jgi:sugar diacid utilization regulator
MRQHKVTEQLLNSDDVIQIDLDESQPRRVIAIRLGKSILGSIWLAGDEDTLSPDADDALRRAAPIAALQLMRQRVAVDVDRRMREAALATLLRGGEAPTSALRRIGLDPDEHFVVVVLEVTAHSASSPPVVGARLIDLLMMYFHGYDHPAAATSLEEARARRGSQRERIYVLTSSHGDADRIVLLEKTSECIKHAARMLGVELRAGIGSEVEGPEALRLARRSAEDCLTFAPPSAQLILYEDVQDQALLSAVERLVADWHASPSTAFRNLVAHDEEHGTEYVTTLSCILDAFGSTSRIAEQLHIHVNTVRYRIRRIAEITGVDLGDCDARLALELTLRAFSKSS